MRGRKNFRRQRSFDPSFFVQKATHESPQAYTVKHQFNDFLISGQINNLLVPDKPGKISSKDNIWFNWAASFNKVGKT